MIFLLTGNLFVPDMNIAMVLSYCVQNMVLHAVLCN